MNLPKVNVMVLQASVVEDICAFSALDRVKDITCVSLLALGIKETTFQFCKTSQSKKTVQVFLQNQKHLSGILRQKIKSLSAKYYLFFRGVSFRLFRKEKEEQVQNNPRP